MISIIIVSWNTAGFLEDCLASILANPPTSPFKSWVVDSASTDDGPPMVLGSFRAIHGQPFLASFGATLFIR
jgi:glycosyltransferase involved in cell wall biosynthesis